MYLNPIHFHVPLYPPSALATSSQNKVKWNSKEKKNQCHRGKYSVTERVPFKHFYPSIFTCKSSFIVKGHWSYSRPSVSAALLMLGPHWDSAPGCPVLASVLWRSCSFRSAGPATSHAAQIIDRVNVGMGQFITLSWGLGRYSGGQATSFSLSLTTRVSSLALS